MSEMKIGIVGCAGRMGRMLIKQVSETNGCVVCGGTEPENSPFVGQDLGDLAGIGKAGIVVGTDTVALFEKADAVIVTADSVNMVCEAATAGKPVFVFPLPGGNRKFKFFHQSMLEKGYTRPFDGRITLFSPPALAETTRIAALVHKSRELHQTRQG